MASGSATPRMSGTATGAGVGSGVGVGSSAERHEVVDHGTSAGPRCPRRGRCRSTRPASICAVERVCPLARLKVDLDECIHGILGGEPAQVWDRDRRRCRLRSRFGAGLGTQGDHVVDGSATVGFGTCGRVSPDDQTRDDRAVERLRPAPDPKVDVQQRVDGVGLGEAADIRHGHSGRGRFGGRLLRRGGSGARPCSRRGCRARPRHPRPGRC